MPPKPEFLGAVSLESSRAADMYQRGFRVFFILICRDDRLPNGMKLKFGSPGPRRATTRLWGQPGSVLTPDDLLTAFRTMMFGAWRRDHYGRDAWWYVETPEMHGDPYAYNGDGDAKWEGMTLRLPR